MTDPTITPAELAKWARLAEAATPGEWRSIRSSGHREIHAHDAILADVYTRDDAAFIAAARTAMPRLIAVVGRQQFRASALADAADHIVDLIEERDTRFQDGAEAMREVAARVITAFVPQRAGNLRAQMAAAIRSAPLPTQPTEDK